MKKSTEEKDIWRSMYDRVLDEEDRTYMIAYNRATSSNNKLKKRLSNSFAYRTLLKTPLVAGILVKHFLNNEEEYSIYENTPVKTIAYNMILFANTGVDAISKNRATMRLSCLLQ